MNDKVFNVALLALPALVLSAMAGARASTGPDGSVGGGTSAASFSAEEYPTWNLPEGATVRLGRGSVSRRDGALAFSPDGRFLAVASSIGVWLYDREDLNQLTLLPVERARTVAFSPDGTTLVSGSGWSEGEIGLWDLSTGIRTATLEPRAWVKYMDISPDGGTLASGTGGPGIELWDLATGTRTALLEGQTSPGTSVSFSPDGTVLVAGEEDGSVRLWDLATGSNTSTFKHTEEAGSVSFSPDGTTVASASADGTVKLWDVATGANTVLEVDQLHVFAVSYSPDPGILASGAPGGTVTVWNLATAEVDTYTGQGGFVQSVAFSPDGQVLASATEGSVFLWDLATGKATPLSEHMGIPGLAFSPDGTTLAATTYLWDGSIDLWDVETGRRAANLTGASRSRVIVFSPDGQTLAQGVYGGEVRLFDVTTGTLAGTLGPMRTIQSRRLVPNITSAAFSPDGRTLAAGTNEDVIYLWDVESRARIRALSGDVNQIRATSEEYRIIEVTPLLFSPNGRTLAAWSSSGKVRIWDVAMGTSTTTPAPGYNSGPGAFSYAPDGAGIRILRLDWANAIGFSPDGTLFAAGTHDNLVRLWEVATHDTLATFDGHANVVSRVLFSPDGKILASYSYDGTILLWDVKRVFPVPGLSPWQGQGQGLGLGVGGEHRHLGGGRFQWDRLPGLFPGWDDPGRRDSRSGHVEPGNGHEYPHRGVLGRDLRRVLHSRWNCSRSWTARP